MCGLSSLCQSIQRLFLGLACKLTLSAVGRVDQMLSYPPAVSIESPRSAALASHTSSTRQGRAIQHFEHLQRLATRLVTFLEDLNSTDQRQPPSMHGCTASVIGSNHGLVIEDATFLPTYSSWLRGVLGSTITPSRSLIHLSITRGAVRVAPPRRKLQSFIVSTSFLACSTRPCCKSDGHHCTI